jgi:hypothetical protein
MAARELANGLTRHRYSLRHTDRLKGGDKAKIDQALGEWLDNIPADARAVLFWAGHGSSDAGHYLVCQNSPSTGLTPLNAIDAQAIGPVIAKCDAEKILVILDTCYSGLGAADQRRSALPQGNRPYANRGSNLRTGLPFKNRLLTSSTC